MNSLRGRLMITAFLVMVVFVAITGFSLQRGFIEQSEQALQDRLQGLVYALLGGAEFEDDILHISTPLLPDELLRKANSGLYALILDDEGNASWRSPSLLTEMGLEIRPELGEWWFGYVPSTEHYQLAFGLTWPVDDENVRGYTLIVAEDGRKLRSRQARFSNTLWIGLATGIALLLFVLFVVLRWGLRPVGKLTRQLRAIEESGDGQIVGDVPDELRPLTEALNAALRSERGRQTRYRNALDDLAHSLKTPLSALSGEVQREDLTTEAQEALNEHLLRMRHIVDYQLNRAATAGRAGISAPIALKPSVEQITNAIAKVYAEKSPVITIHIPDNATVRVDPGDLTEMLGNVIDNAGKWCSSEIKITARESNENINLMIEDDGPGFPEDTEALLKRGIRADNHIEGQGIGLAIVADIITAYDGRLKLRHSDLGGGCVSLKLPNH